jgi:heme/copper-type cytochrome/quinol oxidase subunit 2
MVRSTQHAARRKHAARSTQYNTELEEMTIDNLFSTIILVAFLVTIFLAMGSYGAYKWRESRRPKKAARDSESGPRYFEKVTLGADDDATR